jgi:hypothetical protein
VRTDIVRCRGCWHGALRLAKGARERCARGIRNNHRRHAHRGRVFPRALWASRRRRPLLFTSIAFALWHVSAVTLPTGFDLPVAQIPVFLVNAAVMGAIWGVLRDISGSLVVSSVSHGVWNGLAYALFGYGTKGGALGIRHTAIYGPEVGLVGLALNALVLFAVAKTLNKTEPNANTLYFSA